MERISGGFLHYLAFGYELELIKNIPAGRASHPTLSYQKKAMPFADYYGSIQHDEATLMVGRLGDFGGGLRRWG